MCTPSPIPQQLLRPLNPIHGPLQSLQPLLPIPIPLLNPLHLHSKLGIPLFQEPDPLPQPRTLPPLLSNHLIRLRKKTASQLLNLSAHVVDFVLCRKALSLGLRQEGFEFALSWCGSGRGSEGGGFARVHKAAKARKADRCCCSRCCFCALGRGGAVEGVVALLREAQFCGEGADVVFVVGKALRWKTDSMSVCAWV